jgi:signal transduction histidine kinase/CheY-like chemotaxis protein
MMLIFDVQGNRLYGSLTDPSTGISLLLEEELLQPLVPGHPLVTHDANSQGLTGMLQTRVGLMQIVAYPILTSEATGPIAGSFVVGQFLTDERVTELSRRTTAKLSLYSATAEETPAAAAEMIQKLSDTQQSQQWDYTGESARGYWLLQDVFGAPAALFQVDIPRRIVQIGSHTIQTATRFLALASAIFLLAAWLFMRRLIVVPVRKLTEQIFTIQQTGTLEFDPGPDRSDEVGVLARTFGDMTSKLSKARQALETAHDEAVAMSKTKGEFLARMSHEIRTPMNGVLGMTELLRDTVLDSKQQRFAETIHESAESLLHIINDILDFSKIEAGKLRLELIDVDLRVLLEETVEGLAGHAHRKGLELINSVPPDLHTSVQADPVRIRQVLTNLVGNAIKFTERGEVAVRLTATKVDTERSGFLFEVTDTGIGIRPEKQAAIFDSFTQEDGTTTRLYGGTGLGLAISEQIVDLMGGVLTVESQPGEGSTFSFTLDLKTVLEISQVSSAQPQYVAGARVLIVDDNKTNGEILEHQLRSWRAHTGIAESAEQALVILEAAAASGVPYDLAILDMHMPNTDGLELAQEIRANSDLAPLRMVILSSVATPVSEDALRQLDIAGQLTKPIHQSQLYDSLVAVMGGHKVVQSHPQLKAATVKALSGRVLLAEDNPVNQAVAIGMLESLGLAVDVATNGQEAVEKVTSEHYDVVLMDCQMPVMDGFKATETIRSKETEAQSLRTPIIAVTANALKGDRDLCLAAGMNEYLTKPFTSEQLHSVLGPFLAASNAAPPSRSKAQTAEHGSIDALREPESPIDSSVLAVLSRLQQPGAPDIVQKVVKIYLESSRGLKDKLAVAIDTANAALVRENAHALKSSSANVGATGLAHLCKRLELMGRENDLSDAPLIRKRLEQEYERVAAALRLETSSATA